MPVVDSDFDAAVRQHSRALTRSAYLLTGDWAAAEDLVQTAWTAVWVRWSSCAIDDPVAYMRRTIAHAFISSRRRRWCGEIAFADSGGLNHIDPKDPTVLNRVTILSALAKLPTRQRVVVVLRFFDDLSVEVTAQVMQCSTGTVKSQTSRALNRLRRDKSLCDVLEET